jgi:catechol 2,3-dioxygenase-like lactoylglutathione lyase family enzyme
MLGIHHVALVVENLENSIEFFDKVFALPKINRLTAQVSSHRGAWYQIGSLELHLQERKERLAKTDQHFALMTDQFDEICASILRHGGRIEEAKLITGVSKRCFLYDLDNNRIELLQK